jgi:integrase
MKATLTDRALKALKPALARQRYVVWDVVVPNFGVRVTDKGHRSFIVRRRRAGAPRPIRYKVGDYPAVSLEKARELARAALEHLATGVDPREVREQRRRDEAQRRADTFEAIAEQFIKRHVSKLRSAKKTEALIRRELISHWGKRPVTDITKKDVVTLLREIADRNTPYAAHMAMAYVRKFYNWAIAQEIDNLEHSPCDRINAKDLLGAKQPRQRVLTNDEVRVIWQATKGLGYPLCPFLRMLLITGQRLCEVAEARWSEIDLDEALWTIPPERMKGDHAHEVPLSPMAVELLQALPRFKSGFVFTTTDGERPISGFSKGKRRIDKRVARLTARISGEELAHWRFHDLRRTMRTRLSGLPVEDLVRELVIAHSRPGLHKVYDQHAYRDEKRRALDLWAGRLQLIVKPPKSNVTPLRRKRG